MNGIDKIIGRISGDAQAEIDAILGQAREQAEQIAQTSRAQGETEAAAILERGRQDARARGERMTAMAQLECRKANLAAKQKVIDEAFAAAKEKLLSLPEEEYVELLAGLAVKAAPHGRGKLIFSPSDRARVGKAVVVAANEALASQAAPELPEGLTDSKVGAFLGKVVNTTAAMVTGTGMLTLSQETRDIKGGFILVDGDVEVNCAFETMLALEREKLERQAAERLFER